MAGIGALAQVAGHNSNAPVNYAADRIELQDRQNRVVLSGNVDITQAACGFRPGAPRSTTPMQEACRSSESRQPAG